jgi:hypothetical protein
VPNTPDAPKPPRRSRRRRRRPSADAATDAPQAAGRDASKKTAPHVRKPKPPGAAPLTDAERSGEPSPPASRGSGRPRLKAPQRRLAELLANPEDERNTAEKLAAAGCTLEQFSAWVQQEAFVKYVVKLTEQYTDLEQPQVWGKLLKNAMSGDTRAAQIFLDMKQKLHPSKSGAKSRPQKSSAPAKDAITLRWEESASADDTGGEAPHCDAP